MLRVVGSSGPRARSASAKATSNRQRGRSRRRDWAAIVSPTYSGLLVKRRRAVNRQRPTEWDQRVPGIGCEMRKDMVKADKPPTKSGAAGQFLQTFSYPRPQGREDVWHLVQVSRLAFLR